MTRWSENMTANELVMEEEVIENFVLYFDEFYPKFGHVYRKLSKNIYETLAADPAWYVPLLKVVSEKGDKECQKILITDRTLTEIISQIKENKSTEEINVDSTDSDYSSLYLSLQHCASESTKIAFINKNLNLLKTIKNNRLFPYQKFGAENLENAQLPDSLGDIEDEFYNIIAGAINQLKDSQERIVLIDVIFRYFDKMSSKKQEDFTQRLKNEINTLDANFSKSLTSLLEPSNIDESIKKHLERRDTLNESFKEEIWKVIMSRSLASMDNELLEKVFEHYYDKEEIESFFNNITDKNINIAVDITGKFTDKLPKATANMIIQVFVNKSRKQPLGQLSLLFDAIVGIIGLCSSEYKKMFGDRILELLKDANINTQEVGLKYIEEVIDKIPKTKWEYVSQHLVRTLPSQITAYDLRVTSNIIEGILKLQDYVSEDGRIDFIDFLLLMAKDNTLSKTFRDKGFESLVRVKKLPRKKINQVLEELFQVLKTEPQYLEPCSKALHNFDRYKGKGDFWEEVKEFESQHQNKIE